MEKATHRPAAWALALAMALALAACLVAPQLALADDAYQAATPTEAATADGKLEPKLEFNVEGIYITDSDGRIIDGVDRIYLEAPETDEERQKALAYPVNVETDGEIAASISGGRCVDITGVGKGYFPISGVETGSARLVFTTSETEKYKGGEFYFDVEYQQIGPTCPPPPEHLRFANGGSYYWLEGSDEDLRWDLKSPADGKSVTINCRLWDESTKRLVIAEGIRERAFKGLSTRTVVIENCRCLQAKFIKNCFKGSKVKKVVVSKSELKYARKLFTKKVCGKKVKVKAAKAI